VQRKRSHKPCDTIRCRLKRDIHNNHHENPLRLLGNVIKRPSGRNHGEGRRKEEETLVLKRESRLPHVNFSMDSQRVKTSQTINYRQRLVKVGQIDYFPNIVGRRFLCRNPKLLRKWMSRLTTVHRPLGSFWKFPETRD